MHSTAFPIRIFDVDVFGELRPNVLLRFLWQTAAEATAAAGYDNDWYERQGTLWIIRRTQVQLLAPLHYLDEITIRTWVIDMRRVRSQRAYEVRRRGDDARGRKIPARDPLKPSQHRLRSASGNRHQATLAAG